jgi:carboxymethylenebutenolidase
MHQEEIRVRTDDGEMTTFVAHPDGDGPFPVAVLYMDGVGYREQLRAHARRFAADGFYCAAPDLFYRAGDGVVVDTARMFSEGFQGPEAARMFSLVGGLSPAMVEGDTRAVLAVADEDRAAAGGAPVCIGYCMGARFSLHAASALGFAAAAGIHPGPLVTDAPDSPHREIADVRGELYFAFAEIDDQVTPEIVERFRDSLSEHGVRGEVERVPGVAHGYSMADLPVYDRDASERHFERTLALWRRNVNAG